MLEILFGRMPAIEKIFFQISLIGLGILVARACALAFGWLSIAETLMLFGAAAVTVWEVVARLAEASQAAKTVKTEQEREIHA